MPLIREQPLIPDTLRTRLIINGERSSREPDHDPFPVVKLFTPDAHAVWTLVDEPIVNRLIPSLDDLHDIVDARCRWLTDQRDTIKTRTTFAWWPKNHAPS